MGGTYQTEFEIPTARCEAFFSDIQRDGFLCLEPFELEVGECLARLGTPEMGDGEFLLCFLATSPASTLRGVHFHWHRLRGPDGQQLATRLAARVQSIALRHGGTVVRGTGIP